MKNSILYLTTIMIWGSTFLTIKYQLGSIDPMVSVVYRFGLPAFLLLASLGNITSARNTKNNIPIIQANAYGMAYGAVLLAGIAFFTGKEFTFTASALTGLGLVLSGNYLALKKTPLPLTGLRLIRLKRFG